MLAGAIAFERLQAIARGQRQISQRPRAMNLRQLAERHALNLRRQAVVCLPLPKAFGLPARKTCDHNTTISDPDTMSIVQLNPMLALRNLIFVGNFVEVFS